MLSPIHTHKYAFQEAHVGMEFVGCGSAVRQSSSRSGQVQVGFPNKPVEVDDQRWIVPVIAVNPFDLSRKKEMSTVARHVRNGKWHVAQA